MIFAASQLTLNLAPLLLALAVMTGAGSLLARLFGVGESPPNSTLQVVSFRPLRAWGWSYLLGAASVGLILQIPLAIDGRVTHFSFAAVLLLCSCMTLTELTLRWRRRSRDPNSKQNLLRRSAGWIYDLPRIPRMLTILCLANLVWFSAIESPISFDARSIYGLKARILYDTGNVRSEDFRNADRLHFNANYPLLIPLLEAFLYSAQQSQQDLGMQLLFTGFVLASASVLVAEVRRFESPVRSAMWGACFLLLPISLMPGEGTGLSGSADYALAAFVMAAVVAAGKWLAAPQTGTAVLAGLMLGAAINTKQEGLVWLAALTMAAVITISARRTREPLRSRISAVWTVGIVLGCLLISAAARRGIPNSPYFRSFADALHWDWLIHTWTRTAFIIRYALEKLLSFPLFSFIWPLIAGALVLLRRHSTSPTVFLWRATAILVVAAYWIIFTITPLHLDYQLRTAFYRLTAHVLPLFLLAAAEQLAATGWSRQLEWILAGKTQDDHNGQMDRRSLPFPHARIHLRKPRELSTQRFTVNRLFRRAA